MLALPTAAPVDLGPVLARLAAFAASVPIPPAVAIARAEDALCDIVACMMAGRDDPATRAVARMAGAQGQGAVLAVGVALRLPAALAALVSGTAAHALDFDDNFEPGLTHATAVAASALFALADQYDLDGGRVIAHYVLALELQARIGALFGKETYARGWHATSSIGAIGTAGACAALIGLDAHGIRAAMTIACSMSSGTKKQFGSDMKAVHAGLAAQAAVSAALLAQAGLTGTDDPLGGTMGLVSLMSSAPDNTRAADACEGLAERWALVDAGLMPKRFPCCGAAHKALDGVSRLREETGFSADDVGTINVVVNRSVVQNLRFERPQTVAEARFSLHYPAARVAATGQLSLADMTPAAIASPAARALAAKVTVTADAVAPFDLDGPAVVAITLRDGRRLQTEVGIGRGTIRDPFTDAEKWFKFADCCRWGGVDADATYEAISGLAARPFRQTARLFETVSRAHAAEA